MLEKHKQKLDEWNTDLQQRLGVRNNLIRQRKASKRKELECQEIANNASKSLSFVEESVKRIRDKTLRSVESVTNEALKKIYTDQDIRIECHFSIKRDRSAVTIRYAKNMPDGKVLKRNPEGSGCGVSDVVSLALRMVLIRATGSEPILIADEPFKWIGRDQIPQAAALLKYLAQELGIQIIVTSHHPQLKEYADKAYGIILEDGISKVVTEEEE
jgi:DNA repair exonuclease SbcCD ATPase subunit